MYQTQNKINKKIYVGSHVSSFLEDDYLGSGVALRLAILKYGREAFERVNLFIFDNPEEMYAKEKEIVDNLFLQREDVYNLAEGGHGGFRGPEAHAKQALKMKGRAPSRAAIEKSAALRRGSKDSEEVRLRKSLAAQRVPKDHIKGKIKIFKVELEATSIKYIEEESYPHWKEKGWLREAPPDIRAKCGHAISEFQKQHHSSLLKEYYRDRPGPNKGRVFSEISRQRMSQAHKGHPSNRGRPIKNEEDDRTFSSIAEAARIYELQESGIRAACIGTQKTCGGFHWSFIFKPEDESP